MVNLMADDVKETTFSSGSNVDFASAVTSVLDSLRQNIGVRGAAGEQDHLGQLVEELDGAGRQLCQALDGCGVNFLGTVSAHTESQVVQAQGNEVKP